VILSLLSALAVVCFLVVTGLSRVYQVGEMASAAAKGATAVFVHHGWSSVCWIKNDGREFLVQLPEAKSTRVQSDILNRIQESHGDLEIETRQLLHQVSRVAEQALIQFTSPVSELFVQFARSLHLPEQNPAQVEMRYPEVQYSMKCTSPPHVRTITVRPPTLGAIIELACRSTRRTSCRRAH
jgi:hypothetical protein